MKTASRLLLSLGLVMFLAATTFSQMASTAKAPKTATKQTTSSGKFVDTNKNGICDNHEGKNAGAPGKNFVDKNGDGKCDNCGSSGNCKGTGCVHGQKNGAGCGKGQGKGNCCGKGHEQRNGCSGQGSVPATETRK
jgi:hypothetical protein